MTCRNRRRRGDLLRVARRPSSLVCGWAVVGVAGLRVVPAGAPPPPVRAWALVRVVGHVGGHRKSTLLFYW
jgi:hypothetical protein